VSLLSLQGVGKRFRDGQRERIVLRDVSLEICPGELVGVWGLRRSGRTTLLRIAAGIETPDSGSVRFQGADVTVQGRGVLGSGIGYVQKTLRGNEEQGVLEQVSAALLARGRNMDGAREQARQALARVGAERCAAMRVCELGGAEAMRVALARTLALSPALVVIDEPTATVELRERDELLALLRALAAQDVAVLVSTGEPDELAGFHRALTLGEGELRGPSAPQQLAPVVALRRHGL
jgi:ABC-type lipoprotein export system ATPase subunit